MPGEPALDRTAAAFWRYSWRFYDDPATAATCLALQDAFALDVNLLLFCCFGAAVAAPPLTSILAADIQRQLAPWRTEMLEPLRRLRRSTREAPLPTPLATTLHDRLQAAELEAERGAQYLICGAVHAAVGAVPTGETKTNAEAVAALAAANLAVYARAAAAPADLAGDPLSAALDRLVARAALLAGGR